MVSIECERQLLASWINGFNQEHICEFGYFTYFPEIYRAIACMKPDEINIISIAQKTKTKTSEIAALSAECIPSAYDWAYRAMKEEKIKAMLQETAKNPNNIAKQLESIMKEMDTLNVTKIKNPTDLCQVYKQELEKRKTSQPLKYQIPTLDYITGGLRTQELTVIAARPSIGKTAFALQVAFNLAVRSNKVLFFPLEMSASQLMERIACRETNIKHERLKTPAHLDEKDQAEMQAFFELYNLTMKRHLGIVEGVCNLTEMRRYIEHYQPSVVFIDQLSQIRENKKFASIREQFTYMTNSLKGFARDLNMPVVLLAQISREGHNREPTLTDLKESGSIEEDADNVIMLHQTDESAETYTPMSIIVRKQRNGQRDVKIPAIYLNKKFTFQEVDQ